MYFISTTANRNTVPIIKGIQNLAKKVILEISKFAFNQHYNATSIYASRTHQTALTAEHTLTQFAIHALILATAHRGVELAEVEVGDVTRRARCGARATTYAGLQLGHLGDDVPTLAQVVIVHVDDTRATDAISEIDVTHGGLLYIKLFLEVGIYG